MPTKVSNQIPLISTKWYGCTVRKDRTVFKVSTEDICGQERRTDLGLVENGVPTHKSGIVELQM